MCEITLSTSGASYGVGGDRRTNVQKSLTTETESPCSTQTDADRCRSYGVSGDHWTAYSLLVVHETKTDNFQNVI